jgi:hypothetical protein
MAYIIWTFDDNEPQILDIRFEVLSVRSSGQSHTYSQFEEMVGKRKAEAALKRYVLERSKANGDESAA